MSAYLTEINAEIDCLNEFFESSTIYNLVVPAINGRKVERLEEGSAMYLVKELLSLPPSDHSQKLVEGKWVRYKVDDHIVKLIEATENDEYTIVVFEDASGEELKKSIVEDLVRWIARQSNRELVPSSFQVTAFKWINGKLHLDLQLDALYYQFEMDLQTHRTKNSALFELKPAGANYVALKKPVLNDGDAFLFPPLKQEFLEKVSSQVPEGKLIGQQLDCSTFERFNIQYPQYTSGPMPFILGFKFQFEKEGKKVLLHCDVEGNHFYQEETACKE